MLWGTSTRTRRKRRRKQRHARINTNNCLLSSSDRPAGGREKGPQELGGGDCTGGDCAPLRRQPLWGLKEVMYTSGGEAASE